MPQSKHEWRTTLGPTPGVLMVRHVWGTNSTEQDVATAEMAEWTVSKHDCTQINRMRASVGQGSWGPCCLLCILCMKLLEF